jgi:ABC-type transport system involved in Fe-S cluster assembly fused permease/ATPase subunit
MSENDYWKDLKDRLRVFATQAASILIDAGFLALWLIVQWAVKEYVIKKLEISGIEKFVLLIFQVIFAISTLAPIVIYIYTDIKVMHLRAKKRINQEIELGKANDLQSE